MANRRILVLGDDTQSFLTVVRSLGRAGIEVHVAWCPLDSAALASRYIAEVHEVAPFRADADEWISDFERLFRRVHFDLVIPITDGCTLPLQLHRAVFESLVRIYLLPPEVYTACASKAATWELAQQLGIPVPRQMIVGSPSEALRASEAFAYPLVLKPRASAHERNPLKRLQVEKASDRTTLLRLTAEMTVDDSILIQENFVGTGIGIEVLCRNGRILMAFQHERIHEPMKGGGSSYRRSVALDGEMFDATAKLMQALGYTGVAMVEYKRHSASARWVLIEINARFWGSLALSVAAGLNFPLALVQMLVDEREDFPQHYRIGMYCRHWSRDLQWMLQNWAADKSDRTLHSVSFSRVLLEVFNILALRERSDTLTLDDPKPAWRDLKLFFAEKTFRVAKLLLPYRLWQRAKLKRLFGRADRLVVLCYGNICRSPFAGELLRERIGRNAISRGLHPQTNRRCPEDAEVVAVQHGVDLSGHRSAPITPEEIRSADLILIFDRRQWLGLRALVPDCLNRVAYLGAADLKQPLEIEDPYGHDLAGFQACYERIEGALMGISGSPTGAPMKRRI